MVGVLGAQGTGKTTYVRTMLEVLAKRRRALVVDFEGAEPAWDAYPEIDITDRAAVMGFTGIAKAIYAKQGEAFEGYLRRYYRNGLLIFDDCRTYLNPNLTPDIQAILLRRRQYMLDIMFVAHSFQDVPPRFFQSITELVLFKVTRPIGNRRKFLPEAEAIEAVQNRVYVRSQENPHYHETFKVIK